MAFIPNLAMLAFGMNPFWGSLMLMPVVLSLGGGSPVVGVFLTAAAFALKSRAEELRSAGGAETLRAQRVEPATTAAQPG